MHPRATEAPAEPRPRWSSGYRTDTEDAPPLSITEAQPLLLSGEGVGG
jgi:hypothetical protein